MYSARADLFCAAHIDSADAQMGVLISYAPYAIRVGSGNIRSNRFGRIRLILVERRYVGGGRRTRLLGQLGNLESFLLFPRARAALSNFRILGGWGIEEPIGLRSAPSWYITSDDDDAPDSPSARKGGKRPAYRSVTQVLNTRGEMRITDREPSGLRGAQPRKMRDIAPMSPISRPRASAASRYVSRTVPSGIVIRSANDLGPSISVRRSRM